MPKLVLMSATADFERYRAYFAEALPRSERVERYEIPDLGGALRSLLPETEVKVRYLEDVTRMLSLTHPGGVPVAVSTAANARLGASTYELVVDLTTHIVRDQLRAEMGGLGGGGCGGGGGHVLVFLPTYADMEAVSRMIHDVARLPVEVRLRFKGLGTRV